MLISSPMQWVFTSTLKNSAIAEFHRYRKTNMHLHHVRPCLKLSSFGIICRGSVLAGRSLSSFAASKLLAFQPFPGGGRPICYELDCMMLQTFHVFGFRGSLMTSKPEKRVAMALRRTVKTFYARPLFADATSIRGWISWDSNLQPTDRNSTTPKSIA